MAPPQEQWAEREVTHNQFKDVRDYQVLTFVKLLADGVMAEQDGEGTHDGETGPLMIEAIAELVVRDSRGPLRKMFYQSGPEWRIQRISFLLARLTIASGCHFLTKSNVTKLKGAMERDKKEKATLKKDKKEQAPFDADKQIAFIKAHDLPTTGTAADPIVILYQKSVVGFPRNAKSMLPASVGRALLNIGCENHEAAAAPDADLDHDAEWADPLSASIPSDEMDFVANYRDFAELDAFGGWNDDAIGDETPCITFEDLCLFLRPAADAVLKLALSTDALPEVGDAPGASRRSGGRDTDPQSGASGTGDSRPASGSASAPLHAHVPSLEGRETREPVTAATKTALQAALDAVDRANKTFEEAMNALGFLDERYADMTSVHAQSAAFTDTIRHAFPVRESRAEFCKSKAAMVLQIVTLPQEGMWPKEKMPACLSGMRAVKAAVDTMMKS